MNTTDKCIDASGRPCGCDKPAENPLVDERTRVSLLLERARREGLREVQRLEAAARLTHAQTVRGLL